jgi:Protein of unknown function (DUF3309)
MTASECTPVLRPALPENSTSKNQRPLQESDQCRSDLYSSFVLVIFLLGGFSGRFGGYGYGYGHGGIGIVGIILIILVVLLLMVCL